MALLTALSLTDVQDLRTEANNFDTHAGDVQRITNEMLTLINSTTGVWRGVAGDAYRRQFDGLSDDMTKIYNLIHMFCDDLLEIANKYETTEQANESAASALAADIDIVM